MLSTETLMMEGRGEYYDKSGATRDFLQNHLLQILAIAIMETPTQQGRHDALKSIKPLLIDPNHDVIFGQYR